MTTRDEWVTTTHDWSLDVDHDHLRHIRENVATLGVGGRRHLILEVLAYAADEAESAGRVGTAHVVENADGSVTVADDGRGTDTRLDADGRVVRKPVMATRDVRFFDIDVPPLLPDGLPRRGMSSVAALCPWLVHENRRAEGGWVQTYRLGVPEAELATLEPNGRSGTTVRFVPAPDVTGPSSLTTKDLDAHRWLRVVLTRGDSGERPGPG
ncbi:ATP-binding protein [Knoellia koreensis]|uniref:DNA topoisomerase (ATP-hydrolyzing) n=1 Tax=Knoellia koreensis TaxID=2730921 RepID=A0A849H4M7_9MICO|nr:ATP-binding protein [Knoellia sp. DB2414S]NNM44726.1 ATP-binding protein [Knoellia sp. DB2414S]